mgnify:CR=1 FL=1|jgi:hypothetical protein
MNTTRSLLEEAVAAIDKVLGEGYARKNPELIGKVILAGSITSLTTAISEGYLQ